MLLRVKIYLKLWLFWLMLFIDLKLLFVIYNFKLSSQLTFGNFCEAFWHGLKLDASAIGYFMLIMGLLFSFSLFLRPKWFSSAIKGLTLFLSTLVVLMAVIDAELYRNWGFHIEQNVLLFLKTPKEALASTKLWIILLGFFIWISYLWVVFKFFNLFFKSDFSKLEPAKWYVFPVFIVITAVNIIPVRGGFGIAPINTGSVYFSTNQYANHVAVNVPWNFAKSLENRNRASYFEYMPKHEANTVFKTLVCTDSLKTQSLLKSNKPNILVIVLESFTAKIIEPLGGMPGIAPNFNQLCSDGVLFTNFYAAGDRSDKGLVAILSGFPAQPRSSVISNVAKTQQLPFISHELIPLGYKPTFFYGGNINFANLNQYFLTGKFGIVSEQDFAVDLRASKWGVHDEHLFNRVLMECDNQPAPFFNVAFTLSSHEPFTVPMATVIEGSGEEQQFLNSIYYTDRCLGEFIKQAKTQSWWDNTLVILIADHGSRHPAIVPDAKHKKYHIPMLWLGGALSVSDTIIKEFASQTDLPLMICHQLGLNPQGFKFSNDILTGTKGFGYFVFNNGFGLFKEQGGFVFDNNSMQIIETYQNPDSLQIKQGKAMMQCVLQNVNEPSLK